MVDWPNYLFMIFYTSVLLFFSHPLESDIMLFKNWPHPNISQVPLMVLGIEHHDIRFNN